MMPPGNAPVLIVDDDHEFRGQLGRLLLQEGYPVAEAHTGEAALSAARATRPELVVLDICLPGLSGYEVCHALRTEFGEGLPIMFVSAARCESYDRVAGFLVGGDDYLVKPIAADEFLCRVRRLIRRATWKAPAGNTGLTVRELEVLQLLARGHKPTDVAGCLCISPKTVGTHTEHIFDKLGVNSRAQAVAAAYERGLISTRG